MFLVKSLTTYLSPSPPVDNVLHTALWKTKSPRRVNILFWVLMFGQLNVSTVLDNVLYMTLWKSKSPIRVNIHSGLGFDVWSIEFVYSFAAKIAN